MTIGDGIIQVSLSVWDPSGDYSRHAGATMVSILKNTKSRLSFHILHDSTLTNENMGKLEETARRHGAVTVFHDVGPALMQYEDKEIEKITGIFTPGTLFRLFLPKLVNEDKIIYLDCDIILHTDIKELWNIDLKDNYVAAVEDFSLVRKTRSKSVFSHTKFCMRTMGLLPLSGYFNAGVLALNLGKIRQEIDLMQEFSEFISCYEGCFVFPDQDFLNILFRDKKILLDPKFNVPSSGDTIFPDKAIGKILHFSGRKPWNIHLNNPLEELYWECLRESPWGNDIIKYMLEARGGNNLHLRSRDCYSSLFSKIKKTLISESSIVKICSALLKRRRKK